MEENGFKKQQKYSLSKKSGKQQGKTYSGGVDAKSVGSRKGERDTERGEDKTRRGYGNMEGSRMKGKAGDKVERKAENKVGWKSERKTGNGGQVREGRNAEGGRQNKSGSRIEDSRRIKTGGIAESSRRFKSDSKVENNRQFKAGSKVENNRQIKAGSKVENNRKNVSGSKVEDNRQFKTGSKVDNNRQIKAGSKVENNRLIKAGSKVENNRQFKAGSKVENNQKNMSESRGENNRQFKAGSKGENNRQFKAGSKEENNRKNMSGSSRQIKPESRVKGNWQINAKSEPDYKKEKIIRGGVVKKGVDEKNSGYRSDNYEKKTKSLCPVYHKCGGCQLLDMTYEKQLEMKQMELNKLLQPFCTVYPISGMKNPYHYRNKVHAVFDHDKKGNPFSGVYRENSHEVVPVESCLIEDQKADEIIGTIRGMLKSFKIRTFDEDTGYGLLRHVLVKRGFATGEIMVVLVTASPVFPSKNNFVKALREKHPEITTIIQNMNDRNTSMVLGDKEKILFGKGYIKDVLCGCTFRISSKSFYQVNPVQTEVLYEKALAAAELTGKETVIDAYCGIGTIGIVASRKAGKVIGVELNQDAVKDAWNNAKVNEIENIQFFCNDAGKFMMNMAEEGETVDVMFMDPPRSGSTEEFMDSAAKLGVRKIVYVSCNLVTLERDLQYFKRIGYEAMGAWGVDLFPMTKHCEIIIELCRK